MCAANTISLPLRASCSASRAAFLQHLGGSQKPTVTVSIASIACYGGWETLDRMDNESSRQQQDADIQLVWGAHVCKHAMNMHVRILHYTNTVAAA